MYKNILIATDGSELAETAVSHGVSLAKLAGTKVTALIVEPSFNVFGVPESQVRQMPEAFAKHAVVASGSLWIIFISTECDGREWA